VLLLNNAKSIVCAVRNNPFTSLCITFAVNTAKDNITMAKTSMTVRLDKQQKTLFDDLCSQFGMSANTAINEYSMRDNAISAFNRMRSASSANQELSLDEINAEINEVRANK
jgi:hypothetical protein